MNHVSASFILLYHWSAFWQVGIAHFTNYGMLHFGFDNISKIGFCNIKVKKFILVLIFLAACICILMKIECFWIFSGNCCGDLVANSPY